MITLRTLQEYAASCQSMGDTTPVLELWHMRQHAPMHAHAHRFNLMLQYQQAREGPLWAGLVCEVPAYTGFVKLVADANP